MLDTRLKKMRRKTRKLRDVPTQKLVIKPEEIDTRFIRGAEYLGENVQRPLLERRVQNMVDYLHIPLDRGDPFAFFDPDGDMTTLVTGDGQARMEAIRLTRTKPVTVNAKIFTQDDLDRAGMTLHEWVRFMSGDGTWKLQDIMFVTPSTWRQALDNVDLDSAVVYTYERGKILAPDLVKGYITGTRAKAFGQYPSADGVRNPDKVLTLWEGASLKAATQACEAYKWWWDTLIQSGVPITDRYLLQHRMLTFAYLLWEENIHDRLSALKRLGRWLRDNPSHMEPAKAAFKGRRLNMAEVYTTLLFHFNYGKSSRLSIFGNTGRQ